jgi:TolB protein
MFRKLSVLTILVFLCSSVPTIAQTRLSVHGSGKLYPIALPQLCTRSGGVELSQEIPKVVARDLDLSGYFDVLNPNSYIETPGKCSDVDGFAYSDWSVIGVEGLVKGEIEESGGTVRVQMYLHDVQQQRVVLGKEYTADVTQLRSIAHKFANEIMKFFTGESGVFGSQIAFSGKVGRFKELFLMDMDGSNIRQLTNDRGLAVSAAWSPDGGRLLFTNYLKRQPDLFTYTLSNKKTNRVTNDQEMNIGGKFTPDGSAIIYSKAMGKDSDLFLINESGKQLRRVTHGYGTIEVSPAYSPDGRQIAFVSNRGGGPQIYTMTAEGQNIKRISYVTSNYCTSPAWSPKGDLIAFVCRADAGHQLFVVGVDGSSPLQLTSYGSNEDPSWSPDGRYIAFATTFGRGSVFNLAMIRKDGGNLRQLTNGRVGEMDPAWSPVVP